MKPGPLVEADRALLAAIVDATEQSVISVDLDGRVTSWNRGAQAPYGWHADDALGLSYDEVVAPDSPVAEVLARIRSSDPVPAVESRRARHDGSHVVVAETTAPVRGQGGGVEGAAMIARDVTERHETEALLERYRHEIDVRNEHLERSNRDLEQFAYVASHDLSEDAGAEIVHGELPSVRGDRAQLTRVVQNLLSNAVKFRRPDSPVRVEVSARRMEDGDGWRVEVADDGIGIEEQYRERIFRMFQRLHTADQHPGTGIGLSISERIVDQHGGRMGMDANDLGGSTFWFSLPDRIEAPA
jgi:PAS domain S-box-containing protein